MYHTFLKTNKFLSTSKVISPTHLSKLWSSGPTDGFTNLLLGLRVRKRPIKMNLNRNTKTLYVIYDSRVRVLKYLLTGFSGYKEQVLWQYRIHALWRMDQLKNQNWWKKMKPITVQMHTLDLFLTKRSSVFLYIKFCVFQHAIVFAFFCVSFEFVWYKIKWIAKRICFSIQKYIVTGVLAMTNAIDDHGVVSTITDERTT